MIKTIDFSKYTSIFTTINHTQKKPKNMNTDTFTISKAYEVQAENLKQWASVLNAEAYCKLLEIVLERNRQGYKSPYEVMRGEQISVIVRNIAIQMA